MREFGWFCSSMLLGMVIGLLLAWVADTLLGFSGESARGIMWGVIALAMFEGGKRSQRE